MVLVVLLSLAMLAAACGRRGQETEPTGELLVESVTTADGTDRTYYLYVPSTVGEAPMPLLVALHGGLGSGRQFRENSGFDRLAEANGFLVAFPDGTAIVKGRDNRVWNGGGCCGSAAQGRRNVDDVGFISAMVDQITASHRVDPARVFATGHSNGAIMSYRLACELSDKIVAVAFQAGSLELDRCKPVLPVSVMNLHGLADTNIPVNGGRGEGVSRYTFASPVDSIEQWAALDGCTERSDLIDPSNDDVSGTRWTGCDGGTVVEMILVDGATHPWMGHPGSRLQERLSGTPYPDLDASAVIWGFLAGQARS